MPGVFEVVVTSPTTRLIYWPTTEKVNINLTVGDVLSTIAQEFPGVPYDKLNILAVSVGAIQVMEIP